MLRVRIVCGGLIMMQCRTAICSLKLMLGGMECARQCGKD